MDPPQSLAESGRRNEDVPGWARQPPNSSFPAYSQGDSPLNILEHIRGKFQVSLLAFTTPTTQRNQPTQGVGKFMRYSEASVI
jgi:hypothetical protein